MTRPAALRPLLALLALLLLALPARAQLSAQDQADLSQIEAYLNSLSTVEAHFTQLHPVEGTYTGTFYLKRPGRMRIDYDPPAPYLYIADGTWLTFWDKQLEQRSDVPLGSSLADFITRRNIRLSGDVTVTGLQRTDRTIEVTLVQTDDPGAGQLTLVFNRNPLMLTSWRVVDAQGQTTQVMLRDLQYGMQLPNNLFVVPEKD